MPKMSFSSKDLSRRMKKVEGATVKHARRFVFRRMSNVREVRRHVALWVMAIGLLIGASGLQLYWYQQSYRATATTTGGTYAEAVLGPVETLNPIFARSSAEESASRLMFSRLMTYDTDGTLNYDLAESIELSENKRTYTLKIRPDARWHDGIYVRAKDVVFTVNTLKDPETRASISGWDDITVTAEDDQTVSFTLPAVFAAFPHALTFLPILPEHVLRDVAPSALRENSFSNNPVGSGPFSFRFTQSIDANESRRVIYLGRNLEYYGGAPKLERFQLHVYESSDAIVRALNVSEVNAAADVPVSDFDRVSQDRYDTNRQPINSGVYALFNTDTGVLSDRDVRKALQVGTDTTAVREAVGPETPALSLPFINGQVEGAPKAPAYNAKQAAEFLDEAGWRLNDEGVRQKGDATLRLNVVTTQNSDQERALEALQGQWRDLGISVTTSIVDPSDPAQNFVQNTLQPRDYDVLVYRLTIGGDPDVYPYWHSSQVSGGFNLSNYKSSTSDDALSSARDVTEKELRDAKYATFARQWLRDAPAIGLYQSTSQYISNKGVSAQPVRQSIVGATDRYSDVLYWTVGERFVNQTP
ncbi:MAG TPA: peptide ABC transporter substrate-binding protein [Candidatus Saccharimonadaceae bacterium]|nr:peptide ABC transporter substrate-binding protein [Candidatus Saccharimonadaceae bacterium]